MSAFRALVKNSIKESLTSLLWEMKKVIKTLIFFFFISHEKKFELDS